MNFDPSQYSVLYLKTLFVLSKVQFCSFLLRILLDFKNHLIFNYQQNFKEDNLNSYFKINPILYFFIHLNLFYEYSRILILALIFSKTLQVLIPIKCINQLITLSN